MNQAIVQAHIDLGLAKAAAALGASLQHYRPASAMNPISPATSLSTLTAAFDAESRLAVRSATPPGHPFALLISDPSQVDEGDYLVGADTYFVSRIEPLRPAWVVLCNGIFDILDTAQTTSAGTNSYGGVTSSGDTLVASGWPMSMLSKTRGEPDVTKLPSDTHSAFYEVLMPSIPGFTLGLGLCLQDQNSQLYEVMSFETTAFGCKLMVGMATT